MLRFSIGSFPEVGVRQRNGLLHRRDHSFGESEGLICNPTGRTSNRLEVSQPKTEAGHKETTATDIPLFELYHSTRSLPCYLYPHRNSFSRCIAIVNHFTNKQTPIVPSVANRCVAYINLCFSPICSPSQLISIFTHSEQTNKKNAKQIIVKHLKQTKV